jgi:hypothetical protein
MPTSGLITLPYVSFFPDQEQKIPGNPEILEVILARKSLIRDLERGGLC